MLPWLAYLLTQTGGASGPEGRDRSAEPDGRRARFGKQVSDSVTNLRNTLGGITDAASAQAALPKLQEVTAQIDRVGTVTGQLSAEQRKVLAGLVNPVMPTLTQLFDKVLAIPGVAEVSSPPSTP